MKTNKCIYGIILASLFWVACDDDDDNFLNRPNLNDTDEAFVETAAQSNMAEIEFGELAKTKATDSLVKVFAQEMIDEHTTAQEELEDLADDFGGIDWPDDLNEENDSIMNLLNEAEGYSFDSLYMTTQVDAHENVASIFQTATTNTTEARVKAYATKYHPHIEMHLERADSIHTVIIAEDSSDSTADGTDEGTGEEMN